MGLLLASFWHPVLTAERKSGNESATFRKRKSKESARGRCLTVEVRLMDLAGSPLFKKKTFSKHEFPLRLFNV